LSVRHHDIFYVALLIMLKNTKRGQARAHCSI
jgi:hypothetical protein